MIDKEYEMSSKFLAFAIAGALALGVVAWSASAERAEATPGSRVVTVNFDPVSGRVSGVFTTSCAQDKHSQVRLYRQFPGSTTSLMTAGAPLMEADVLEGSDSFDAAPDPSGTVYSYVADFFDSSGTPTGTVIQTTTKP